MSTTTTENYKGYAINITANDPLGDPLENPNMLGTIIAFHDKITLGHSHNFKSSIEAWNYLKAEKAVSMPVYLIQIAGIYHVTVKVPANKANGLQIGWIYVNRKKAAHYGELGRLAITAKRKVYAQLEREVEEYNEYLHSGSFNFTITNNDNRIMLEGYYYETKEMVVKEAKKFIDSFTAPDNKLNFHKLVVA